MLNKELESKLEVIIGGQVVCDPVLYDDIVDYIEELEEELDHMRDLDADNEADITQLQDELRDERAKIIDLEQEIEDLNESM